MHVSLPTAFVVAAVLLFSTVVEAQPRLEFETVKTSGPTPSISGEFNVPESEIVGFSMDPIGMRVHWVHQNQWHKLDLRTGTWTLQAINNGFDLVVPRWGVVPGTNELRAWDDGVGRVVRIDPNGVPTRIDRSFNQKTQYGHISHVEPNGTIHAIGGVGLYYPKNYGISFSEASSGWHRTSGDELVVNDPFLLSGYAINDPMTSRLILLTAYGVSENPKTKGILEMDVSTGSIRVIHPGASIVLEQSFRGGRSWLQSSVTDGSHRIAFFLSAPTTSENQRKSRLMAMDLDTYRIIELEGLTQGDTDPGTNHTVLHYNEADSTLFSVQWSHHTIDMVNFVAVSKAKIDLPAIQTALKKGMLPSKAVSAKRDHPPIWPWQLALVAALMGWIGVWWKGRRNAPISAPPVSEPNQNPTLLALSLDPLRLDGRPWIAHFGEGFALEGQLLDLLARAHVDGQPIVNSDTVDRQLIPNHPSPDYIRKTRNQTRKRLEESLQSLNPLSNGECYILTDRDITDKRKTKMQLNPRWVEITRKE